jgi:hypothetical protein
VLNQLSAESSLATDTNREVLANLTGAPCLGELGHCADSSADDSGLRAWLEAGFDYDLLRSYLR